MKAFFLLLLFSSFIGNTILAQEWSLVTPIKNSSELRGAYMATNDIGFVLDKMERRVLKTKDGGYSWERMYFYLSYQPTDLWMWDADNGIICASSGRFYKTTNGFQTYSLITGGSSTMYGLYFVNTDTGYAAGDNGSVLKTTNGGSSWSSLTTGVSDFLFNIYFVDDTTGFACGNSGRIIKTIDGGNSWVSLTTGTTSRFYDIYFSDTNNGIAVGAFGLYMKTIDGGANWTSPTSPTSENIYNLRYSAGVLMALCADGVLLRSVNHGNTWTSIMAGNDDHYVAHINNNGVGISGGDASVYKTTDYGANWTLLKGGSPHSLLTKVSFADNNYGLAVGYMTTGGNQNAIIRTSNGGNSWVTELVSSASNSGLLGCHLLANGEGVIGGSSGRNAHTNNYGDNFTYGSNQPSVAIRAVWAFSETKYIVGGGYINSGIYLTENGGSSWAHTTGGTIQDFFFPSDSVGYAVGDGGAVMKTVDQAATWTGFSTGQFSDYYTVFFLNDTLGYVAGSNGGRKTIDGGQNWTAIFPSGSYIQSLLFFTADSGYAVTYGGVVTKTIDGGNNWTSFASGVVDQGLMDADVANNKIVAVGSRGDVFLLPLSCYNPIITPAITQSNDTLFSSASTNNQWYNSTGPISGGSYYVPTTAGEYYTIIEDPYGCSSDSSNHIILVFTSVSITNNNTITLYPNPSSSTFYLEGIYMKAVEIRDINGRLIQQKFPNANNTSIDLSGNAKGIYLIKIIGIENVVVKKLVFTP
jgi:photosystem II stability/assembly factor-like uncharacterized protein